MKRYSLSNSRVRNKILQDSQVSLDIFSLLENEGCYFSSDSFFRYSENISRLLRLSQEENIEEEIVPVEDVDKDDLFITNVSDKISDVSSFNNDENVIYAKVFEILKSSGNSVYNALSSVSNSIEDIFPEDYHYDKMFKVLSIAFSVYYKVYELRNVSNFNNALVVRDVIEKRVNYDTVALFAKVYNKSKKADEYHYNNLSVERSLVNEMGLVKLSDNINDSVKLHKFLSSYDPSSWKIVLGEIRDFCDYLESIGLSDIVACFRNISFENVSLLLYYSKLFPREFSYFIKDALVYKSHVISSSNLFLNSSNHFNYMKFLGTIPEKLWAYYLWEFNLEEAKNNYFSYKDIISKYDLVFPEHVKSGKVVYKNIEFSDLNEFSKQLYLLGEENLKDRDALINNLSNDYENDEDFMKKFSIKFNSYDNKHSALDYCIYHNLYKYYGNKGERFILSLMNEDSWSDSASKLKREYLDYYLKFFTSINGDLGISYFNNVYPIIGNVIFEQHQRIDTLLFSEEKISSIRNDYKDIDPKGNSIIRWYTKFPFMIDIPFDDWFNFFKERIKRNPFLKDDGVLFSDKLPVAEVSNKFAQEFSLAGKILYLVGINFDDRVSEFVSYIPEKYINFIYRDYFVKLLSNIDNLVGDLQALSGAKDSLGKYFFGNYSPCEFSLHGNNPEQILKVRGSISKSKNYSHIKFGSEEYEKIFAMISMSPEIRGRDPKLLCKLFDETVRETLDDSLLISYLSVASGIKDFSFIENSLALNFYRSQVVELKSIVENVESNYLQILSELDIKKEDVIKIGGFRNLLYMSKEEFAVFKNMDLSIVDELYMDLRRRYGSLPLDIYLKIDFKVLLHKLIIYYFKMLFAENPEFILGRVQNPSEKINDLRIEPLLLVDQDFVAKVMNQQIYYPKDIVFPSNLNYMGYKYRISNYKENIKNAGNLLKFFNKDLVRFLNLYSSRICTSKGFPPQGYDNIPDQGVKAEIIHDIANILPKKIDGYNEKLVLYYENNLGKNNDDLKLVAESWNKVISLLNEEMKFQERGFVNEFAEKYSVVELAELIRRYNAIEIFKVLDVQNAKFGVEFINRVRVPNNLESDSSDFKFLFNGCQEIYLRGLGVEMPSWSSFQASDGNITMRFLPREDPRGMFLGNISNCCQHPQSYAASCAYDGHINPLACFAVFEKDNKIIFQSYVWADEEGNVCFDSLEAVDKLSANKSYIDSVKALMKKFSASISGRCNVGSNRGMFMSRAEKIFNPSRTNEENLISQLLAKFEPLHKTDFYDSDSKYQYEVE